MMFPFKPKALFHEFGGQITEISGITHEIAKPKNGRSQDIWDFVGDVIWADGTNSKRIKIGTYAIKQDSDEGKAEYNDLMDALHDYLIQHGKWYDEETGPEHQGWYANERN